MDYVNPRDQKQGRVTLHPSHHQAHVSPISSPLYVVTAVTNPYRFRTRYELYRSFEKMCSDAGAVLYTVELALRNRHHEVTDPDNPRHIQLRSPSILWHKENLLNIGVSRLPHDWEYVAWIDADVVFARPDWVQETLHQLQLYHVVQMWSHAIDYGPEHQPIATFGSFFAYYLRYRHLLQPIDRKDPKRHDGKVKVCRKEIFCEDDTYGSSRPETKGMLHTGYAWAARRSALADLGGLGEVGVLGSGDRHMAYALVGQVRKSLPSTLPKSYGNYWLEWERRAEKYIRRNVGVVPGTVHHYWHGSKQFRRYQDRWQILTQNRFNWPTDLKKDTQGVLCLTDRNLRLRDDIRHYFSIRNEDSIDL